jgi:hypothetical protein
MPKKYVIRLEAEERVVLEGLMRGGRCSVRKVKRAQILLQADVSEAGLGWKDEQIAQGAALSESASQAGWGKGSEADCGELFIAAAGSDALDVASSGRSAGGAGGGGLPLL